MDPALTCFEPEAPGVLVEGDVHTSTANNIQVALRWYALVCTPVLLLAIVAESHITRVCRLHARLAIVVLLAMVAESHLTLAIVVTASSAKLCDLE